LKSEQVKSCPIALIEKKRTTRNKMFFNLSTIN